jgi:16S rRNA (uracil1498-N3)-methyltransferase
MARRRFFVPAVRNGTAEISGEDARHLTQVLRAEAGQIFEISDNEAVYLAEISTVSKSRVVFQVMHRQPDPPPAIPVELIVALFKFDRLEMLLEKATELGVTSVRFVRADRSDKGLDKAAEKRIELVGPEGGWVAHEREEARAAGWISVTMGDTILRAETAAIAALAVVNAALRR